MNSKFDRQQELEDDLIRIIPLKADHFEALYQVASDPLIWEQHPNKDRYRRDVFETFFEGALASEGAYLVLDKKTGAVIGSSRYYDLDEAQGVVAIGYTFIARQYWGQNYNPALKRLMINYAFQYLDSVVLHVGSQNLRSQKAVERLGAKKIDEQEVAYYGEPAKLNYIYQLTKADWISR
ncbi:MAG: GNAT family N-acetyltransferase [Candidatus Pedobacter colombiensis]|uniref:GNAT family N-acetyltransferase n=1 Tax=Candidatus Pedobacter colombiensis TaxID=3121371 RepID=A0AAJ6B7E9_9SPHI|nr:GNAT family N-acetyltransferase [Pedobacter sp.]WEK21032.1 MAG: GNAT family N-acetyltransferase [Pedobacter sp.]